MKRFFVKNEMELFVGYVHDNSCVNYVHMSLWAINFETKFAAEMFIRFLATLTDAKMTVVEVDK